MKVELARQEECLNRIAPCVAWHRKNNYFEGSMYNIPVICVDLSKEVFWTPQAAFGILQPFIAEFTDPGANFILRTTTQMELSGNIKAIKNFLLRAEQVLKKIYILTERQKIYEESGN